MEEKKIIKVWDNGILRELTEEEMVEYEKQNENTSDQYQENIISYDYDEAVNQKIRERYTESQEFAILRQRDEKPDEFAEYYEYCEQCKTFVKELLNSQS